MVSVGKLGLVGKVVLLGGAVGGAIGLVSGCGRSPVVDVIVTRVVYDRVVNPGEIEEKGNGSYVISRPNPVIEMRKWRDNDENKMTTPNELFEDIGDSVNMNDVGIMVNIGSYWSRQPLVVSYTILDSHNEVIATRDCSQQSLLILRGKLSPGKYTLVAKQGTDIHLSRDFMVTK